jgi:recombination protein RecA
MNTDVIKRLKNAGLLSEQAHDLGFVSTGSYALNKVISGNYMDGIPIGQISQFHGESSTAKTVFATHILKEAQSKGYYSMLVDSENAYNPTFARTLGLDPERLIYSTPETLEDSFQVMEETILSIRESDPETPIVIAYDSIAVSPSKVEYDAESYDGNNMQGAVRAKATGACLRKINPLMRKHKVALIVINQIRSKVGVMYGNPETMAAGGKSLDYYLGVNLKCISNKTADLIRDDNKQVIGITGTVRNTKNKVSIPFRECEFELMYDDGLNACAGLLKQLVLDNIVDQNGAWYNWNGVKFQRKEFDEKFLTDEKFSQLRKTVGVESQPPAKSQLKADPILLSD